MKRRRERRINRLRIARRAGTLPDMKAPEFSHVAVLRLAHRDNPSLREVGRAVGVSKALLSQFERGVVPLSDDRLERYAKAIERDVEEVKRRWLHQSLVYHEAAAAELREAIRQTGTKRARRPRGARGKSVARK